MAATNVQAFSGDVKVANTLTVSDNIVVDDGVYHPLTIDPTNSMIYNKSLYFPGIGADTYNYLGRFRIYAPPAIFNIWDSGTALGSGSRYSMSKAWGSTQAPVMNALEGSEFSTYNFYWEPEAAGGASEESVFYHVWFSPSRAGDYTFYIHAKEYQFPTEPSSPTYNDVIYGLLNLADNTGTQSHVVVGRPSVSGAATLQLHNESQTTGDRLTHEAIQLFSNTTPATGDVSNVFITMTPSITNGGYGGYIEGWLKSGTNSGLSLGSISSGTKYRGLTVVGASARVGIGTTTPDGPLHISKSAPYNGDTGPGILFTRYANTYGGCIWNESNNDLDGLYFNVVNNVAGAGYGSTPKMVINSNGHVGIGTNNPGEQLFVSGNIGINWADDRRLIMKYDNDYRQGIEFDASTRVMTLFSTTNDAGGAITFRTRAGSGSSDTDYGTERMRINHVGRVGIGTNNPGDGLHINTGNLRFGNNSYYQNRVAYANSSAGGTVYFEFGQTWVGDDSQQLLIITAGGNPAYNTGNFGMVACQHKSYGTGISQTVLYNFARQGSWTIGVSNSPNVGSGTYIYANGVNVSRGFKCRMIILNISA